MDEDGKDLVLGILEYPTKQNLIEQDHQLYGTRPMSRTLDCGPEEQIKQQNELLASMGAQQFNKQRTDNSSDSIDYVNHNCYYEDYHESDQDSDQFIE